MLQMLVKPIPNVADVAIFCVSIVAIGIGIYSCELRSTRLYIAKVPILRSRFELLSVKGHHQLQANMDYFPVSET